MIVALKNWFLTQPLLLPTLSLAVTIYLVEASGHSLLLGYFTLSILLFLSALSSRKVLALSLLLSALGAIIHYRCLTDQKKASDLALEANRDTIEVYGIIDSPPRHLPSGATEVVIKVISEPSSHTLIDHKILAYLTTQDSLNVGEKIWLRGNLNIPNSPKNPDLFDLP